MSDPHDFEFQFGRNRMLRGRGWKGLLALGLLLTTFAVVGTGVGWVASLPKAVARYRGDKVGSHYYARRVERLQIGQ